MKKWIKALALCTLLSSSAAIAQDRIDNNSLKNQSYWNPITLYNHADYNVIYSFRRSTDGIVDTLYLIRKNSQDVYHSGLGDKRVQLYLEGCAVRDGNGRCLSFVRRVTPEHYNAEEIATVQIQTVNNFTIICRDGSTTSCLVP